MVLTMKNTLKFGFVSLLLLFSALAQDDAIIIPKKTKLAVRINQYMDNTTVKFGYSFTGSLVESVVLKGKTVFPEGSFVEGHVDDIRPRNVQLDPGDMDLIINMVRNGNT